MPYDPIKFEIEDNAKDLFHSYIESMDESKDFPIEEKPRTSKKPISKKLKSIIIDLHQLTLPEAKNRIDDKIMELSSFTSRVKLKIITGKGIHSKDGVSILAKEIHSYVASKYKQKIKQIDTSPEEVKINNRPIRGFFRVILDL